MVSKEEIKKLAELARIEIDEKETESLQGDMNAILDYVGQVSSVIESNSTEENEVGDNHNVFRDDDNPNQSGGFTESILDNMPNTEDGYLKVKKIL